LRSVRAHSDRELAVEDGEEEAEEKDVQAGAATLQLCFHGATAELREKVAFEVTANQAACPCILYIYI
jgi:hypothetical protein